MVASCSYLLAPNIFQTRPAAKTTEVQSSLGCNPRCFGANKRRSSLPAVASISCPPLDAVSLDAEFSGHGVSFSEISDSCVVKMVHENGSVAKVMLPSGLITSYKPLMWHGGTMELLHTSVSEGENGGALVHGGVSLAFTCDSESDGISWSPSTWVIRQVNGNPQESIQVELNSKNAEGTVEVKHFITLREDHLSSAIIFHNSSNSPLKLKGSIVSHLTVSTPEATSAIGLEGSDFFSKPPVSTDFSLLPPSFGKRNNQSSGRTSGPLAFMDFFSGWSTRIQKYGDDSAGMMGNMVDMEGEEKDNYKSLAGEMSRIYTNAPRNFTVIDRGRRNSVVIRRDGFNELYMFSPGSSHDWYGKYAYICVGQAAMHQPVTLASHSKWKGEQYLCNPNL